MITIYIIYHVTFENTNMFTTNPERIENLKSYLAKKTYTPIEEWKVKQIKEEEEFQADLT